MKWRSGVLVLFLLVQTFAISARSGEDSLLLLPVSDLEFVTNPRGASFSYPWKADDGRHGDVIRFPAGFDSGLHTHTAEYRGVVIEGVLTNPGEGESTSVRLPPGSTWFVPAGLVHATKCVSEQDCLFYVHQQAAFDFTPVR